MLLGHPESKRILENHLLLLYWLCQSLLTVFSSVQSLSHVQVFATPWTTAYQASLCITNSRSPPKPMSIESVMPYNHLILCHPLLLLPSIFPSIRVFSKESVLCIRWSKYWSFASASLLAMNIQDWSTLTSDMQMTPPLWQRVKKNSRASWWKWKRRV